MPLELTDQIGGTDTLDIPATSIDRPQEPIDASDRLPGHTPQMPTPLTNRTQEAEDAGGDAEGRRVVLRDIGHSFESPLYHHIDLTLLPRHVYALTGPSGSGKSTLLSIIAGWLTPTEGDVDLQGINRVEWVLQNPYGVARREVIDHISLPFLARGDTRAQADRQAAELLDVFGLTSCTHRLFRDLSGGEAQRLMLARGVATGADLLLVDEPTAQLDLQASRIVNDYLGNISISGAIVVIATHDPRTRDACTDVIDLRDYQ